jgi:hypothetical protein
MSNFPAIALHLPDVPAWLAGASTLVGLAVKQPLVVAKAQARLALEWEWAGAALGFLKGAHHDMNALQLIPVALTLGEDALKLTQALEVGDKATAVAAVLEAIPLIAHLAGQDPAVLTAQLTPARVEAAFDFLVAIEKIVVAVEAHPAPVPAAAE